MSLLPEFKTPRLILREITPDDYECWYNNFNDYEIIRNLSSRVPWPYPKDGIKNFYENSILPVLGKDQWLWGIFLKDCPSEVIGCVHLWRNGVPEHRGFWLARKLWGKGIMTEAVGPLTEYAFNTLDFTTLVFSNAKGNLGSRRIKEKTGAVLLRERSANFNDPQFTQAEVWELTKEHWARLVRETQGPHKGMNNEKEIIKT